ncbi:MAG: AAA family ATPase, partial [Mucispirillum sp.]|nr:AAA family ATPase [Mucispirillum sp.]
MLLKSMKINNLLSFDENCEDIELDNLNIIIGPNGSGKSNFIQSISLLKAASTDLKGTINKGGGISEWLWKGSKNYPEAHIKAVTSVKSYNSDIPISYELGFTSSGDRFEIVKEYIADNEPRKQGVGEPYTYYKNQSGELPCLNAFNEKINRKRKLVTINREDINLEKSILEQLKEPYSYPELYNIADKFSKIMIYRNISTNQNSLIRSAQQSDLQTDVVLEDGSNLALFYNYLNGTDEYKEILNEITQIYNGIEDIVTKMNAGKIILNLRENINDKQTLIPASRLSDGTLQYLFLLAILFNPTPPPLICLEEPEMGLHPDL